MLMSEILNGEKIQQPEYPTVILDETKLRFIVAVSVHEIASLRQATLRVYLRRTG
jgi:hypothetical protein